MMNNVRLKKHNNGTWVVIADTARFGKDEIMYESFRREDCVSYLRREGVYHYEAYVDDDENIIGRSCSLGGMTVKRIKSGWKIIDEYGDSIEADTFEEAMNLLWNMAPNNDVSDMLCEKCCDKWYCLSDGSRMYVVV